MPCRIIKNTFTEKSRILIQSWTALVTGMEDQHQGDRERARKQGNPNRSLPRKRRRKDKKLQNSGHPKALAQGVLNARARWPEKEESEKGDKRQGTPSPPNRRRPSSKPKIPSWRQQRSLAQSGKTWTYEARTPRWISQWLHQWASATSLCSKIGITRRPSWIYWITKRTSSSARRVIDEGKKVLRDTQIRSMHEMGQMKRAQELRVDEVSVQKWREKHETTQKLTSQLQEMQEQMNSMNDSGEFQ